MYYPNLLADYKVIELKPVQLGIRATTRGITVLIWKFLPVMNVYLDPFSTFISSTVRGQNNRRVNFIGIYIPPHSSKAYHQG